jgi:hypothetical protein
MKLVLTASYDVVMSRPIMCFESTKELVAVERSHLG